MIYIIFQTQISKPGLNPDDDEKLSNICILTKIG